MNNLLSLDIFKTTQRVKVTPKDPEEVRVQRQLTCWLDPGWCMTPPTGAESKVNRTRRLMLWWIAGVLMLLGLVGLVTSYYPMGGFIYVLLVLAMGIVLVRLIHGGATFVIAGKENRGLTRSRAAVLLDPGDLARFEGEGGLEALEPDRAEPAQRLMSACTSPKPTKSGTETINQ